MDNIETWKAIPGYDTHYEASSFGRIRSKNRTVIDRRGRTLNLKGKMLKPEGSGYGMNYVAVNLSKDGKVVHREVHTLIALTFLGTKPDGKETCHNDGNGTNNHLLNLRYDCPKSNHEDAVQHGTFKIGERSPCAKLTELQVRAIRNKYFSGYTTSMEKIATEFGVSRAAIRKILYNLTWKHLK